jgi:hypothetical protein
MVRRERSRSSEQGDRAGSPNQTQHAGSRGRYASRSPGLLPATRALPLWAVAQRRRSRRPRRCRPRRCRRPRCRRRRAIHVGKQRGTDARGRPRRRGESRRGDRRSHQQAQPAHPRNPPRVVMQRRRRARLARAPPQHRLGQAALLRRHVPKNPSGKEREEKVWEGGPVWRAVLAGRRAQSRNAEASARERVRVSASECERCGHLKFARAPRVVAGVVAVLACVAGPWCWPVVLARVV